MSSSARPSAAPGAFPASPPSRVLLGPGPSDPAPQVLEALSRPSVGHLDPAMLQLLDTIRERLGHVFQSRNPWTFALSGTGTAGMEASLCNLLEPGDRALVAVHGYFGARMAEICRRLGAQVEIVESEWGQASDVAALRHAAAGRRFKLVCCVHAETSTGVLMDLVPMRALADELGALLVVDAVTSLGCIPLDVDGWKLDAVYSCSQKGLSCISGLSPITFSERARESVRQRRASVPSFYLDLNLLSEYWGGAHAYHHTASSNMYAALGEALRLVTEEGLSARIERHRLHSKALQAGLAAMGLELLARPDIRLPQLLAVRIPDGVDDARVRGRLLRNFGIEIGGGLGPLKGRIWRIGLMGQGAHRRNVCLALAALRVALHLEERKPRADGVLAADQMYADGN